MNALDLFRMISLHHILHNKTRTIFVLLIVAIGSTSVFVAVDAIFKREDSRRFGNSLLHGKASISIETSTDSTITMEILEQIRASRNVERATPLTVKSGLLVEQSLSIPFIGIDPDNELSVRPYELIDGNFISATGQILITDAFANDFRVGDTVRLASRGGIRSYKIAGILAQKSIAALNGGDIIFLHYSDVQDICQDDSFDFVSVIPSDTIDDTLETLQSILPDQLLIENVNASSKKDLTDYVIDVLGIISNGLPAVLGALIITNTLSAGIAQRRKELAILRALGTTQHKLLNILMVEACILGFIGSLFGMLLAILLNQGMLTASATVENIAVTANGTKTPVWIYGIVTVTGVIMAMGAMWIPARKIVGIDATEAMRPPIIQTDSTNVSKWRVAFGLVFLLLAVGCRVIFDNSQLVPIVVLSGVVFVMIGMVLLFPPLFVWFSRFLPMFIRQSLGFSGLIAAENLNVRHQRAIATGLTALLVIWFYVLLLGFTAGQDYLTTQLVDTEFDWDIIIAGPGEDARSTVTSIQPDIVEEITARDDVAVVVNERLAPYVYDDIDFIIRAIDLETYFDIGKRFAWEDGDESLAYARLLEHDNPAVLIGGFDALMAGLRRVGTTITLSTPNGDLDFDVVGTINTPDGNTILMNRALYTELWDDMQVDRMSINLIDPENIEQVRRDLSQQYQSRGLSITDQAEIRALFNQSAGNDFVIGLMLFPFMMLGIANMFFISVLDRRREFGMLRAIGALRGHIVQAVIIEVIILVILVCCAAIPAAYFSIEMMLFDRIAGAEVQPDIMLTTRAVFMVIIASTLAAYMPARRAGQLDILDTLRYE